MPVALNTETNILRALNARVRTSMYVYMHDTRSHFGSSCSEYCHLHIHVLYVHKCAAYLPSASMLLHVLKLPSL